MTDPKQVLVIQKSLGMRKGKIGAQAAHASWAAFTQGEGARITEQGAKRQLVIDLDEDAYAWFTGQYRKVCVSVSSEAELLALHAKLVQAGLRCALVYDNGLTEFKGVKTLTALVVGPHPDEVLDPFTGHLPLL